MALPENDSPQNIVPSLFGIIGGILATCGFFLPWYANANVSFSGWDFVNIYLTGKVNIGIAPAASIPISLPIAFIAAIPLLLALVALALGIIGLFMKNTALSSGLYGASGIVGLLTYQSNSIAKFSFSGNYPSTTGLGIALLIVGYFGIITASIVSLAHYVKGS